MRGLGGKRGATDPSPIARQQAPRSHSRTRNLRPPSLSAIERPPAFPSGRSLETAPTGPGATCCHDAPAAPHLAFATPIDLGHLYIAGNRTGSILITAR